MRKKKIIVFIDLENVQISFKDNYGEELDPNFIVEKIKDCGQIVEMRAYANYKYQSYHNINALRLCGMQMIHTPNWSSSENGNGNGGKSTTDEEIITDIVEIAETRKNVNTIVVVSGDGGYIPALNVCRKKGIEVIAIAVPQCTNSLLLSFVDEFIPLSPKEDRKVDLAREIRELQNKNEFLTFPFIMNALLKENKCLLSKRELCERLNTLIQQKILVPYKKSYKGKVIPCYQLNHHRKEASYETIT